MIPVIVVIPVPVVMTVPEMPIPMAIHPPTVIPITVMILPAMLISIRVGIPFALVPSVMMSSRSLVVVMVAFVIPVPSAASVTISPGVAPKCQRKPNQCDAYDHESAYHVALLCFGLLTVPCHLSDQYDGSER